MFSFLQTLSLNVFKNEEQLEGKTLPEILNKNAKYWLVQVTNVCNTLSVDFTNLLFDDNFTLIKFQRLFPENV